MFFEKNNRQNAGQKVLVAPLDWGLGHATRCIPVIYSLLNNGATVVVAAGGPVKALLEKELPQVTFLPLPGYKIRYSRRAGWLPFRLLLQLPRLLWTVYAEHIWLKKACKTHGFNAVISDNRPGLYNSHIHSVYITHQLTVKTGNRFTERAAQWIHYRFIHKFNECWVPDNETENILAGDLSHPKKRPNIPVTYLGPLSRFEKKPAVKKYDLLVLLSGPEPQRSIFEKIILGQLQFFDKPVLLVRGLPGGAAPIKTVNKHISIHNHLDAASLNDALLQSGLVICRSGYTTVMDLAALQQKAVMIPTPGQTEQEYLARFLQDKKIFYCTGQQGFILTEAMEKAASFPYIFTHTENDLYKKVVTAFVQSLQQKINN